MRPKLNIKPYNIFEAYQQRLKQPINPGSVPANYTFTGEQLGIEEPVKQIPADVQRKMDELEATTSENKILYGVRKVIRDGKGVLQPESSGKLDGFFSGLTGRRREWPGSANAGRSGAIGYLGSMYTSPEEEERYLRQSQNKTKLMAVADALRQFGNIYYTSRYATPQKFNDIYAQERARYLQDKAIRDRNNVYYAQQKQREAQLEMQREKIAADAERRNEELAMKREINNLRKPYYENQAKAAEINAQIKEMEANSKPDELKQKSDKRQADIENVKARTNKTNSDAENNRRRTNALNAKTYNSMNNGGGSSGGGGSKVGGSSAIIRISGKKGSYARKQAPTQFEIDNMYQDAVDHGYVNEKNRKMVASGEQTKAQVITKVATYTKDADKFFARHGYTKVYNEEKPKTQAAGKGKSAGSGNSGNGKGTWGNFSIHKKN